jgi:hypothetical protein
VPWADRSQLRRSRPPISSIVKHLRALADREAYSQLTRWVKGGHNPRTGEVWLPRERKRPVRRRVKRWRNRMGYGFELFNDPLVRLPDIARIIRHYGDAYIIDDGSGFLDDPPAYESTPWTGGDDLAVHDLDDFPRSLVGGADDDRAEAVVSPPF